MSYIAIVDYGAGNLMSVHNVKVSRALLVLWASPALWALPWPCVL